MNKMEWIYISEQDQIPTDKTIIVEDENFWMGQAYFENGKWYLETFGRTFGKIEFAKIERYFVVPD
jgi:hypothetical protein